MSSSTLDVDSGMANLFKQGTYSDLQITCKGITFKVHRNIVRAQSPFFDAALKHNFKEAATQIIDLPDDDPEIIERVLCYLYTQDYMDLGHLMPLKSAKGAPKDISETVYQNHIQVYIAADKFGIKHLETLAAKKSIRWIDEFQSSAMFLEGLETIMASIMARDVNLPQGIGSILAKKLINKTTDNERVYQVLNTHGALASDVVRHLANKDLSWWLRSSELDEVISKATKHIHEKFEKTCRCKFPDWRLLRSTETYGCITICLQCPKCYKTLKTLISENSNDSDEDSVESA